MIRAGVDVQADDDDVAALVARADAIAEIPNSLRPAPSFLTPARAESVD